MAEPEDAPPAAAIPSEELVTAVGAYVCPEGYSVLPRPSTDAAGWRADLRSYWWTGLRVAHIFEGGWSDASYFRKAKPDEADEGFYVFYYKDTGEHLAHDLDLDEWGTDKSWVIIKKD